MLSVFFLNVNIPAVSPYTVTETDEVVFFYDNMTVITDNEGTVDWKCDVIVYSNCTKSFVTTGIRRN